MDKDMRFIYLNECVTVRVCEINAVIRPKECDGQLADHLFVFTGNGDDYYYKLKLSDFNKTFGTEYSNEHLQKHLLELFLNELNEGVVNRQKDNAEVPVYIRKPDNSVVLECPVCGWKVNFESDMIQPCHRCGVMLDISKVRPAMRR